jgi:hypothetical protein
MIDKCDKCGGDRDRYESDPLSCSCEGYEEACHPYEGPGKYFLGCRCENCKRSSKEVGGFMGLVEKYKRDSQSEYDAQLKSRKVVND